MNYDIDAINRELWLWRAVNWPQLSGHRVEVGCIPRFSDLGLRDKYFSGPEVLLRVDTVSHTNVPQAEVVSWLKECETDFYQLLNVDGIVPKGQLSYRGAFWEYVPSFGFFALLSYANSTGYAINGHAASSFTDSN